MTRGDFTVATNFSPQTQLYEKQNLAFGRVPKFCTVLRGLLLGEATQPSGIYPYRAQWLWGPFSFPTWWHGTQSLDAVSSHALRRDLCSCSQSQPSLLFPCFLPPAWGEILMCIQLSWYFKNRHNMVMYGFLIEYEDLVMDLITSYFWSTDRC